MFNVTDGKLMPLCVVSDLFLQHSQVLLVLSLIIAHASLILVDQTLHLLGGALFLLVSMSLEPLFLHLIEIF